MNDKYTKHSMMMTDKKYCRRKVGSVQRVQLQSLLLALVAGSRGR